MSTVEQLVAAVQRADLALTDTLLREHPDLRARLNDPLPGIAFGGTILQPAVSRQNRAMIELLVANGADINAKSHWWAGGFSLLETAPLEIVPFLIERGARLDVQSASRLSKLDELTRLLDADPSLVTARAGDGQTPL